MDEETTWRWRWRCPDPGCDVIIQGEGSIQARAVAEDLVREHQVWPAHRKAS